MPRQDRYRHGPVRVRLGGCGRRAGAPAGGRRRDRGQIGRDRLGGDSLLEEAGRAETVRRVWRQLPPAAWASPRPCLGLHRPLVRAAQAAETETANGMDRTALDAQGPPMRFGLAADPDLVSPNAREAEEIVGYELNDDTDLVGAAETIAGLGAHSAIVHQADGCVARLREPSARHSATYRAFLPARDAASTVGSGDALIGGLREQCIVLAEGSTGLGKGRILGASLADVKVDIPDFESHEEMLLVRGIA